MVEKTEKAFRKLLVWQKAHQLVLLVYKLSESFPKSEMFGLTSQLRRAAVSVPANMAEGYAAGGKGQSGRFLNIAQGSLAEVEYYLILSQDLKYITATQYQDRRQNPCAARPVFSFIVSSNPWRRHNLWHLWCFWFFGSFYAY